MKLKKAMATVISIASAASMLAMGTSAEAKNSYQIKFDSADTVNSNFEVYYQADAATKDSAKEDLSAHWEIKDGKLVRSGLVSGKTPGTGDNNAMLYLKDTTFQYFEAELTWEYGTSWGWTQLGFGSPTMGAAAEDSKAANVFFSQEGQLYLDSEQGSLATQTDAPYDSAFKKAGVHTMKVKVVKGTKDNEVLVTVSEKQDDNEYKVVKENISLVDETVAKGGYIFIQVQNDDVKLHSLNITRLNADGTVATDPAPEAPETPDEPTSPSTGVGAPIVAIVTLAGASLALVAAKKHITK